MTHFRIDYLHRDERNHKTFGAAYIVMDLEMSIEAIEGIIRSNLIDGEYFWADEWGLPYLGDANMALIGLPEWHEFIGIQAVDIAENGHPTIPLTTLLAPLTKSQSAP